MQPLEDLLAIVAHSELAVFNRINFTIPEKPSIYVPPTFHYVDNSDTIESEVVFVQAPAAVGKSMTAKYIASSKRTPILDLARTPVGTDSLRGMIGNDAALEAFRAGTLPIVVDAMDEGRIVSGEKSFEQFLATTGVLLTESPHHNQSTDYRRRPKIIFFGRSESVEFANLAIQLLAEPSLCRIELDYFAKDSAVRLVNESAEKEIGNLPISTGQKQSRRASLHSVPMTRLKDTYFSAIASALGLSEEALWTDEIGRSFAGYAPVLSTLAIMIARSENPHRDQHDLEKTIVGQAWDVVSRVLSLVMEREQEKFQEIVANEFSSLPDSVFSRDEQLSYLAQLIRGSQIDFCGDFQLKEQTKQRYMERVSQFLPEHPFVRDKKAANDVLGSAIVAHVILTGIEEQSEEDDQSLGRLSRQPFMWRHARNSLSPDTIIYGYTAGYLLNSYFNDPVTNRDSGVRIQDNDDGGSSVLLVEDNVRFDVIPPVTLFEAARNCDIETAHKVVLDGRGFVFSGTNSIVCGDLELRSATIWVYGSLKIVPSGYLSLGETVRVSIVDDDAYVALSPKFRRTQWPSRSVNQWIDAEPNGSRKQNTEILEFLRYLRDLPNRFVVVTRDYHLSNEERNPQWKRIYTMAAPHSRLFLRTMVSLEIADIASVQAGTVVPLFRVTFNDVDWDLLISAFSGENNKYREVYETVYRFR